jgi:hypothetical protein
MRPSTFLLKKPMGYGMWMVTNVPLTSARSASTAVGLGDRHVRPESERVVPIDPEVIRVLGAARVGDPFELRPRKLIQGPTLRTVPAGPTC